MAKWHLNQATGDYNKCTAKPGNCPIGGGDEQHFNTKQEAQKASEKFLENKFGKFTVNTREVKQQQTKQLNTLFKIYTQLDDAGYEIMRDYAGLVVRKMVEGKPKDAKRFMDEIVKDLKAKSNKYSTVLQSDWKMGIENVPETLKEDEKDITSKRLRLLYQASDYFDDAGIDLANEHSASILLVDGPFSEDNKLDINGYISDFANDLTTKNAEANWLKEEDRTEFEDLMNEYYSINKY